MQAEAKEAVDLSSESEDTQKLYGLDDPVARPYGEKCLLARRLVERGVRVYEGTPGAKAGIVAGDTITAIGSTRVSTSTELRSAVAAHFPGDSVDVTWTDADGTSHTATVTLAQGPVA